MFLGDFPDHWLEDDQEYEDQWAGDGPRPVVCKFCGATDLYWHKTAEKGWRLADMYGVWHVCPKPKPKSELDFSRSL